MLKPTWVLFPHLSPHDPGNSPPETDSGVGVITAQASNTGLSSVRVGSVVPCHAGHLRTEVTSSGCFQGSPYYSQALLGGPGTAACPRVGRSASRTVGWGGYFYTRHVQKEMTNMEFKLRAQVTVRKPENFCHHPPTPTPRIGWVPWSQS